MKWRKFEKLKIWSDWMETSLWYRFVKSTSWAVASVGWHRACKDDDNSIYSWLELSTQHFLLLRVWFFPSRFAASYLLRTCILVFNSVLWTKPEGGRDLPCITALTHCGWLHRSIKFREVLLRFTLQCQPKCYCRNDKKTYRYVFISLCEKPMP